jgi:hypothetical protein
MQTKKYFIFALIIIFPSIASATGYNYLPNDIYIKQQEEKAALEYRISTLETSLQNSPTLSVLNIESRISQLEQEKQTEINYITGLYGKNGISNQLPSAIAEIDAKYDSQIDNLEQQIEEYEDMMSEEDDLRKEIQDLKNQLSKVDQQVSQGSQSSVDTSATRIPSAIEMFDYIDALPNNEAEEIMGILGVENNKLYEEVLYLVQLKYPNGKPGSAMYNLHSENSNNLAVIGSGSVENEPDESWIHKTTNTFTGVTTDLFQAPTNVTEPYSAPNEVPTETPTEEPRPVTEEPKSIWQSIVSFFKKLWW